MKLVSARIKNFRGIRDLTIEFADTTALLGENSTGKSAVLDAIRLALSRRWGGRGSGFVEYDFFMDEENRDPKSGPGVSVELLFAESKVDEWHEDIINDLNDVVQLNVETGLNSIRLLTECRFDATTRTFESTWTFLALDGTPLGRKSQRATNTSRFFDYAPVFSVSALRDSAQEFSSRSAFWGQLLRRVDVPEEVWRDIEAGLQDLNARVLAADPKMEGIRKKLGGVGAILSDQTASGVDIRALPLKAWDLIQRAEVIVRGRAESPWLPLGRHGHGVQSLSVIYLFQAFVEQLLRDEFAKQAEPLLLLEEPEAHLHPQAARSLGKEMASLPGQKIVTTHSPYFVERISFRDIRIMRTSKNGSAVYALRQAFRCSLPANEQVNALIADPKNQLSYDTVTRELVLNSRMSEGLYRGLLACFTSQEDRGRYHPALRRLKEESLLFVSENLLAKLQDWARRTRGEIFFARAWLLCEGQAEYLVYGAVMDMLDFPLDRNGISIIDYKVNGDPVAFVSLARAFGFPWILTCDGDGEGNTIVKRLVDEAEVSDVVKTRCVRQLHCTDLETLLVTEGLKPEILSIAKELDTSVKDSMKDEDLVAMMRSYKIEFAARLADRLRTSRVPEARVPKFLLDLKARLQEGEES